MLRQLVEVAVVADIVGLELADRAVAAAREHTQQNILPSQDQLHTLMPLVPLELLEHQPEVEVEMVATLHLL
jgi:hypothetical protein